MLTSLVTDITNNLEICECDFSCGTIVCCGRNFFSNGWTVVAKIVNYY